MTLGLLTWCQPSNPGVYVNIYYDYTPRIAFLNFGVGNFSISAPIFAILVSIILLIVSDKIKSLVQFIIRQTCIINIMNTLKN